MRSRLFVLVSALFASLVVAPLASADPNNNNSAKLTAAVTVEGIQEHLVAFQSFATAFGDNRFAGLPGHDASAQYVYDRMVAAGYDVRFQDFQYEASEDLSTLTRVAPPPAREYVNSRDFLGASTSVTGDVTAQVFAVDLRLPSTGGSTSGCEPADFAGFVVGAIALMQRGTCNFAV